MAELTNREKRKLHFKTIMTHRKYVRQMCWKFGLYWQGLVHDLSKYSPREFSIYKYYTDGSCSPHANARKVLGYSPSWMYHKNKNKHQWEFWLDNQDGADWVPVKIPYKYLIEMCCDMTGASKAYSKNVEWKPSILVAYWFNNCKGQRLMHKDSEYLLEHLFLKMDSLGFEQFISWYKKNKKSIKQQYESGDITKMSLLN